MNRYEHDINGVMVGAKPLFASTLLALYYVLRKNFNKRREAAMHDDSILQADEE